MKTKNLTENLDEVQDKIDYQFDNLDLLLQAFTRSSYSTQYDGENNDFGRTNKLFNARLCGRCVQGGPRKKIRKRQNLKSKTRLRPDLRRPALGAQRGPFSLTQISRFRP